MTKPLTQQSIRFLQLSQCDAGAVSNNVPHVCCARNDDSLILEPISSPQQLTTEAPSAFTALKNVEISDDSIKYNKLLPNRSECGREQIENRIYSGQVRIFFSFRVKFYEYICNFLLGCSERRISVVSIIGVP